MFMFKSCPLEIAMEPHGPTFSVTPTQHRSAPHRCVCVAFAMAIPRCQWRHRCVVTLGEILVVFVQETIVAKGKMKAKAERRCARCQKVYMAMLQNRVSNHSDDAIK